ncbi:MAG: hypothetical protein JWR05_964 [Mucilaginibacter sp.]|nr:hypothetical protein [Mucilaginibacter sp.]
MKEYVLILKNVPITPELLAIVRPKWALIIPRWAKEGHLDASYILDNESFEVSGKEGMVKKEEVTNESKIVISFITIKAESIEQAIELAKECPTLESGGTVEVRAVATRPTQKN